VQDNSRFLSNVTYPDDSVVTTEQLVYKCLEC